MIGVVVFAATILKAIKPKPEVPPVITIALVGVVSVMDRFPLSNYSYYIFVTKRKMTVLSILSLLGCQTEKHVK